MHFCFATCLIVLVNLFQYFVIVLSKRFVLTYELKIIDTDWFKLNIYFLWIIRKKLEGVGPEKFATSLKTFLSHSFVYILFIAHFLHIILHTQFKQIVLFSPTLRKPIQNEFATHFWLSTHQLTNIDVEWRQGFIWTTLLWLKSVAGNQEVSSLNQFTYMVYWRPF